MTSRSSTAAPILAVLAVVLVTLAAYLGGYFWLGQYYYQATPAGMPFKARIYRTNFECWLFDPLAKIESKLSGCDVLTNSFENFEITGGYTP
jgi:hypothetical protein